jgi:hypothetical protein
MSNDAPIGHFDAGVPLYIVRDESGEARSYHSTEEGANAVRSGYGEKATIDQSTLHH